MSLAQRSPGPLILLQVPWLFRRGPRTDPAPGPPVPPEGSWPASWHWVPEDNTDPRSKEGLLKPASHQAGKSRSGSRAPALNCGRRGPERHLRQSFFHLPAGRGSTAFQRRPDNHHIRCLKGPPFVSCIHKEDQWISMCHIPLSAVNISYRLPRKAVQNLNLRNLPWCGRIR